jgi:aspartate aminotransferase
LVGGSAFGTPGYIRFSYATSDEKIIESVKRIKESLKRLY